MLNEPACSFLATHRSALKYTHGGIPVQPQSFERWPLEYLGVKCLEQGHLGVSAVLKRFFSLCQPADQPNHAEEENCAVIRTESSGRWQNRDCSVALPYVCKKRPNATLDPFTTGECMSIWTTPLKWNRAVAALPQCRSLEFNGFLSLCSHRLVGRWWEIWVRCGLAGLPGWLLQADFREERLGYITENLSEDGGQPGQHPHPAWAGVHHAQPEERWFDHFFLVCYALSSELHWRARNEIKICEIRVQCLHHRVPSSRRLYGI